MNADFIKEMVLDELKRSEEMRSELVHVLRKEIIAITLATIDEYKKQGGKLD